MIDMNLIDLPLIRTGHDMTTWAVASTSGNVLSLGPHETSLLTRFCLPLSACCYKAVTAGMR